MTDRQTDRQTDIQRLNHGEVIKSLKLKTEAERERRRSAMMICCSDVGDVEMTNVLYSMTRNDAL